MPHVDGLRRIFHCICYSYFALLSPFFHRFSFFDSLNAGEIKVKKRVNEACESRFRLLLREPNTHSILINMSIMQTMSHEISKNVSRQVRVTGVNIADDCQAINAFMIVLKSGDVALALQEQLTAAICTLEKQTKALENSSVSRQRPKNISTK